MDFIPTMYGFDMTRVWLRNGGDSKDGAAKMTDDGRQKTVNETRKQKYKWAHVQGMIKGLPVEN